MERKTKYSKFNFTKMLLLFALVPMSISILVLNTLLIEEGSKEIKDEMQKAMASTANQIGLAFDYNIATNEAVLKNFSTSPILIDYLKDPGNEEYAKRAEEYTLNYFGNLEGWEGVYLADWNSKVMTHPAEPVIGRVMREGDALKSLQNAMLSAENGVYNVGIITSPASGELIISMYVPIFDGDKPIGYVGGGTFVNQVTTHFSDVSKMELSSAYAYFADREGVMLYHPDPEKIGKPVENDAVKNVVAKIAEGNHPEVECVSYKYKGAQKYAAYFVGQNERYVTVVTADEKDVLADIKKLRSISYIISAVLFAFFVVFVAFMTKVVTSPLKKITKALDDTANGNLNTNVEINSIVYETQVIVEAAKKLQSVLKDIIGKTQKISEDVNAGAADVASLADNSSNGTTQIVGTMEELARGATVMAENVQNINIQVISMGEAVDDISNHTNSLVTSSNNIKSANADADEYMSKVSDSSKHSVEAVNDITKQISETNAAIETIKDAVDIIISIASQTNLLSLNASIEAARAGEAGRGFAVVAGEIKTLSEQSNDSANTIRNIVANIIEQSSKSVSLAAEVANIISTEQGYISEAQNKFRILSDEIQTSLEQIEMISKLTVDLNSSKNVIHGAVSDLSAISEENVASNEEVTASINDVSSSVYQIVTNSDATKQLSEELKETISYFN